MRYTGGRFYVQHIEIGTEVIGLSEGLATNKGKRNEQYVESSIRRSILASKYGVVIQQPKR